MFYWVRSYYSQFLLQKPERRKLTNEEIEAKRKEMIENAEWRDKTRKQALKKVVEKEKIEEKNNEGKPADFIRCVYRRLNCKRNMLLFCLSKVKHRRD